MNFISNVYCRMFFKSLLLKLTTLQLWTRGILARTLVHPRKFPADMPAGCMPDPTRHSEAVAACGGSLDEVAELAMRHERYSGPCPVRAVRA